MWLIQDSFYYKMALFAFYHFTNRTYKTSSYLLYHIHIWCYQFFLAILLIVKWYTVVILTFISLMTVYVELLFVCVFMCHLYIFIYKMSFIHIFFFFFWWTVFSLLIGNNSSYIFNINPLIEICCERFFFLPFVCLPIHFLNCNFLYWRFL